MWDWGKLYKKFYYMCIINYSRNKPICYAIVIKYLHVGVCDLWGCLYIQCSKIFGSERVWRISTVWSLAEKSLANWSLFAKGMLWKMLASWCNSPNIAKVFLPPMFLLYGTLG